MSEDTNNEAAKIPTDEEIASARKLIASVDDDKTWRDDERVKVTPTHFEIDIFTWAQTTNKARLVLEENPDNLPPNKIQIRRLMTAGDSVSLDDYEYKNVSGQQMALACILSAGIDDISGRISWDMMKRMSWQDYNVVTDAVADVTAGKG